MQLVERHLIKKNHIYYREIDKLCYLAKNLYNSANYIYRQNFFKGVLTDAISVYHQLKTTSDYQAMPAKVAQNVLGLVMKSWKSYTQAQTAYQLEPHKEANKPQIPGYKGSIGKKREDGRYVVPYNNQAFSKKALKKGYINPSGTSIYLKTKVEKVSEIRLVPKQGFYVVEVVYEKAQKSAVGGSRIAAIDLGLNNLAVLTANFPGFRAKIYDGRPLKSLNQYANKKNALLRSLLPPNQETSNRLQKLWLKRNSKVEYYLHTTSRAIINELVNNNIGLLVIGWDENFKDSCNFEPFSNQNFVSIPHQKLIKQLQYKGKLAGIEVVLVSEGYTSLCSAIDLEPIQKHETYAGQRIKRGLFKSSKGFNYNADVNGSLNIGRKAVGNEFISHPIEGVVVHPVRVKAYKVG